MATSGDLSGILRDLADLRTRLDRLGKLPEQVAGLAAIVETAMGTPEEPPPEEPEDGPGKPEKPKPAAPIWWPALADDEYARLRRGLRTWLRDVLAARYPRDAALLTKCWEKHPVTVDALTAAWLTWQAAYTDPGALSVHDGTDWQIQTRTTLVRVAADDLRMCKDARDDEHVPREPFDPDLLASFEPEQDRSRT